MPMGAVLLFDGETEAAIRAAWTALADSGVSRSMLMPGFRPHVTLAFGLDADGLTEAVRLLAATPLRLSAQAEVLALVEGDETGWTDHAAHRLTGR